MEPIESSANEKQIAQEKPNNDPKEFIDRFAQSELHENALLQFLEGKTLDPAVSDEQKEMAFYNSRNASDALLNFYTSEENKFTFQPDKFSEESQKLLDDYINIVKKMKSVVDQDELTNLDAERSVKHVGVATQLVKDGIVPSVRMGRMLARIILADQNIEGTELARTML